MSTAHLLDGRVRSFAVCCRAGCRDVFFVQRRCALGKVEWEVLHRKRAMLLLACAKGKSCRMNRKRLVLFGLAYFRDVSRPAFRNSQPRKGERADYIIPTPGLLVVWIESTRRQEGARQSSQNSATTQRAFWHFGGAGATVHTRSWPRPRF